MVTTTTTLPTSRPVDGASSEERAKPKAEEVDMYGSYRALRQCRRQARFESVPVEIPINIWNDSRILVQPVPWYSKRFMEEEQGNRGPLRQPAARRAAGRQPPAHSGWAGLRRRKSSQASALE